MTRPEKKQASRPKPIVTPAARFKFPKLNEPDTKWKEEGEYAVTLVLEEAAETTQAFLAAVQPHYEEALNQARLEFDQLPVASRKKLGGKPAENPIFTPIYDEATEEPTGEIQMKFAMKASGVYRYGAKAGQEWTRTPKLYDAKGTPLDASVEVWGGTVGKVSFTPSPYFVPGTGAAGLKLNLEAVQIIDLVSRGQRSADSFGFGEEDGYEFTTEQTPANDNVPTAQPEGGDADEETPSAAFNF